jgi:hypothetical protein
LWEAAHVQHASLQSLSVSGLEIRCLHLPALILLDIVGYALVFSQRAHSRALNVGNVDKRVSSATLRLDEAETFGLVEKLDCACRHLTVPFVVDESAVTCALGKPQ